MEGRSRPNKREKLVNRVKEGFENMLKLREKFSKCEGLQMEVTLSQKQIEFLEKRSHKWSSNKVTRVKGSIEDVNAKSEIVEGLFQGDMLLSKEQQNEIIKDSEGRLKRQAYNDNTYPGKKWPGGVYCTLDNSLSCETKEAFRNATYLWMNNTCIDFIEDITEEDKRSTSEDIILVYKDRGCWAELGRHGEWQLISLGDGCETCSRIDQFEAKTMETNNNYNLTYDYGSVMHYGASAFINETLEEQGRYTIISKDVLYTETLGSAIISFYDLLMMNMYYNCTDACNAEPHQDRNCSNGGLAHLRNCSKCICPSGYGGQFRDERPPGCGAVLNASTNWTVLENQRQSYQGRPSWFYYIRCQYWIEAPANKTIEIEITEVPTAFCYEGCKYAGVEIKTHPDLRRTGYRFCSNDSINTTLTSNLSRVPVITYISEKSYAQFDRGESYNVYDEEYEKPDDDDDSDSEDASSDGGNEDRNEGTRNLTTGVRLKYRFI